MTCKDCIHYDVCHTIGDLSALHIEFDDEGMHCMYYKEKSQIVELPCKEGENLYYVSKFNTIGCFLNVSYETILMCVSDCRNREKIYISKNREECEEKLKKLKQ